LYSLGDITDAVVRHVSFSQITCWNNDWNWLQH